MESGNRSTTAQPASNPIRLNSSVGKRVRRIFDLALHPPPKTDPDPGNPVPFSIRKDLNRFRIGFYLCVLSLIALTISAPRTYLYHPLTNEFRAEHLVTGVIFLVLVLISHYLVTGSDPGYLDNDLAVKIGEEHAQHNEISHRRLSEDLSRVNMTMPRVLSSPTGLWQKKGNTSSGKSTKQKSLRSSTSRGDEEGQYSEKDSDAEYNSDDDFEGFGERSNLMEKYSDSDESSDDEPDEQLDQSLSGIPVQRLPIRSKYCRKSRRVVATYDHHCRVINTTIGERNKARFWFLLLWGTCGVSWLLSVAHSGFRNSPASVNAWFSSNGHALASAIICWIVLLFVGGLFLFHTFLMLANITSYEFMRADKVSYLASTRDFDLPFSMGIKENVKFYFSSDSSVLWLINRILGRRIEWKPHLWSKPVPMERNSDDVCKNIWENRYWSCC